MAQTINESFVFINASCNYKNKAFVYIIRSFIYRLALIKSNLAIKGKEVCNKKLVTYLLTD